MKLQEAVDVSVVLNHEFFVISAFTKISLQLSTLLNWKRIFLHNVKNLNVYHNENWIMLYPITST